VLNFLRSTDFDQWLRALKDQVALATILRRLSSAELGNFGDFASVGHGVNEMRVHHGPGYRLYFTRRGDVVYLLLCGGTKKTQKKDIKRAIALSKLASREIP
jgi:putative addiction module killer protein